jgi:hypothetical protein
MVQPKSLTDSVEIRFAKAPKVSNRNQLATGHPLQASPPNNGTRDNDH